MIDVIAAEGLRIETWPWFLAMSALGAPTDQKYRGIALMRHGDVTATGRQGSWVGWQWKPVRSWAFSPILASILLQSGVISWSRGRGEAVQRARWRLSSPPHPGRSRSLLQLCRSTGDGEVRWSCQICICSSFLGEVGKQGLAAFEPDYFCSFPTSVQEATDVNNESWLSIPSSIFKGVSSSPEKLRMQSINTSLGVSPIDHNGYNALKGFIAFPLGFHNT